MTFCRLTIDEVIATFVDPQTRRLGDLAAGTVVVRDVNQQLQFQNLAALENQIRKSPLVKGSVDLSQPPVEMTSGAPHIYFPGRLLSYRDIQLIEIYFQRRKELTNRALLAGQLATNLWLKMKLTGDPPVNEAAEKALADILDEYRQANSR